MEYEIIEKLNKLSIEKLSELSNNYWEQIHAIDIIKKHKELMGGLE